MTEEVTTTFWVAFFVEAGIPPAASANYAIIFSENRIQKHMLLDLNKEYLKDMGVNVLGDIIAILKHAKLYHEKVARERVLAVKAPAEVQTSVKKATKHLNEMLHKEEPEKPTPAIEPKPVTKSVRSVLKPSPPKKIKTMKSEVEVVKEKEEDSTEELEELKRKVIPPSKLQQLQPIKKVVAIPVPPSLKKSSVFERLGDSNVTSTTPEAPDSPAAVSKLSSVFQRLGKTDETKGAFQTKTLITAPPLKKVQSVSQSAKVASESALRMDMESGSSNKSAKQRLLLQVNAEKSVIAKRVVTSESPTSSTKRITSTPSNLYVAKPIPLQRTVRPPTAVVRAVASQKLTLNKSAPSVTTSATQNSRTGIKKRLGSVAAAQTATPASATTTSNVFKRLGLMKQ